MWWTVVPCRTVMLSPLPRLYASTTRPAGRHVKPARCPSHDRLQRPWQPRALLFLSPMAAAAGQACGRARSACTAAQRTLGGGLGVLVALHEVHHLLVPHHVPQPICGTRTRVSASVGVTAQARQAPRVCSGRRRQGLHRTPRSATRRRALAFSCRSRARAVMIPDV